MKGREGEDEDEGNGHGNAFYYRSVRTLAFCHCSMLKPNVFVSFKGI